MADPTLKIKQDETGGKKVQESLQRTSAAFYETARASRETAAATRETSSGFGGAAASAGMVGAAFLTAANQAAELAQKAIGAAGALVDFAKAGANAADIGARYSALGDAVATMQALKAATANAVDETSLQRFAALASEYGLTAQEAEAAARGVTVFAARQGRGFEVAKLLNDALKGNVGTLRELGIVVDKSSEAFEGMSAIEKKAAVTKALTTAATKEELEALDSQTIAMAQAKTTFDDLLSNVQVFTAELLVGSGALDGFKEVMAQGQKVLADNREAIATIVGALTRLAEITAGQLIDGFERFVAIAGSLLDVAAPLLDLTTFLADGFAELQQGAIDTAASWLGLSRGSGNLVKAYQDVIDKGKALAATQKQIVEGAQDLKAEFKISDPATDETVRGWERAIRQGKNLDLVVADIVAQSSNLEEAYKDLANVGEILDLATSTQGWTNLDKVIEGVEKGFAKTTTAAAKAKEEFADLGTWIDSLSYRLTGFTPETMWSAMVEGADEAEKKGVRAVRRVREEYLKTIRDTRAAEERAQAERYEIAEQQLAMRKEIYDREEQAARDSREAITGAALDGARAIGSQTAAFLGGGWARAGFEAAFETGLGIANLFTPPSFGAEHFAAAAQLLIAQAFAESNGASGSKSAASSAPARPAAAAQAIVQRPDVASQGNAGDRPVQLWINQTKLAESVRDDLGAYARRGGKGIPVDAIGGSARRAIGG